MPGRWRNKVDHHKSCSVGPVRCRGCSAWQQWEVVWAPESWRSAERTHMLLEGCCHSHIARSIPHHRNRTSRHTGCSLRAFEWQ